MVPNIAINASGGIHHFPNSVYQNKMGDDKPLSHREKYVFIFYVPMSCQSTDKL